MSKYNPEEYQRNKEAYIERQRRYKSKNRNEINQRQREYRKNTPEKLKKYKKTKYTKKRHMYKEYMTKQKCSKCGFSDYRALVWHHIDPSTKKCGVTRLVNRNHSWKMVMEEIEKCICLCHNCHMILHYPTQEKETPFLNENPNENRKAPE